jgi:hypothetical protein
LVLLGLLTIALLASRDHSWAPLSWAEVSLSAIHWPGLWLSDRLGWRAPSSAPAAPDSALIDAALEHAFAGERQGDLEGVVAGLEVLSDATIVVGLPPPDPGVPELPRPVVADGVLIGFAEAAKGRSVFVPLPEAKLLMRVMIEAGNGDLIPAVLTSDGSEAPRMRYPALRAPLTAGLMVRTASGDACLPDRSRAAVPAGLQVGWLENMGPSGALRQYRIRLFKKARDVVSVLVLGPRQAEGFHARRTGEFRAEPIALRGPVGGLAGHTDYLTLLRGVAPRGTVACGAWYFGQVARSGLSLLRVSPMLETNSCVSILLMRGEQVRHARVRLATLSSFELLLPDAGVRPGDWMITSGTDLEVPPGLLLGRVRSVDGTGLRGTLERPLEPAPGAALCQRRSAWDS